MKFNYLILIVALIISGCSSTPKDTDDTASKKNETHAKRTEREKRLKERTIRHELLESRGFYPTSIGNINYKSSGRCYDREIQSHRGLNNKPENSRASIIHAIDNGFNVVEIDVMQLRDGTWVLHHDTKTGRATVMPVELSNSKISRLRPKDWNKLHALYM